MDTFLDSVLDLNGLWIYSQKGLTEVALIEHEMIRAT